MMVRFQTLLSTATGYRHYIEVQLQAIGEQLLRGESMSGRGVNARSTTPPKRHVRPTAFCLLGLTIVPLSLFQLES